MTARDPDNLNAGGRIGFLLSPGAVVALLGFTPATVRAMLRRGDLPGLRLGGRWRVREAALDAALDRMERERAEVHEHAARVLRRVREDRARRRLVAPLLQRRSREVEERARQTVPPPIPPTQATADAATGVRAAAPPGAV